MASSLATIRTALHDQISTQKDAAAYVDNSFTLEETWSGLPSRELPDLTTAVVRVVGLGFDSNRLTRGSDYERIYPVQVAIQKQVDPTDVSSIDTLVELLEQLQEEAMSDTLSSGYTWIRNEALKDPDTDLPFHFVELKESLFEAYFTAYYKAIHS